MGAACSVKDPSTSNLHGPNGSKQPSRVANIITKHSSQFKENYSKYHLFENRWTTVREYQKLPFMVRRNFQKVLERGMYKKPKVTPREPPELPKENNFLITATDELKPSAKQENNENTFWSEPQHFYINKLKTLNLNISMETNEISELSNLLFFNVNYRSPLALDVGELVEEKSLDNEKLNNILGTLNYHL